MKKYWWEDFLDHEHSWQGLVINVAQNDARPLEMQSGHNGRLALKVKGETLFWATVLKDHGGVWLIFNAEHTAQQQLLPTVTSADVERAKRAGEGHRTRFWSRFFAGQLMAGPAPLLAPGRWLLRPMDQVKPTAPYVLGKRLPVEKWRFQTPACSASMNISWSLYSEDFPDLQAPKKVQLVDWWWGGYLLLARYPVEPESGRVKWWRKKSLEGSLPPVLVWFISGLASFVILDGHDRLQAALAEGIQPQFLVLSEIGEQTFTPDEKKRQQVLQSLAIQQEKRKKAPASVDAMNQSLIELYDTQHLYALTHSRAVLGKGEGWEREVKAYLQRHDLKEYLANILAREE